MVLSQRQRPGAQSGVAKPVLSSSLLGACRDSSKPALKNRVVPPLPRTPSPHPRKPVSSQVHNNLCFITFPHAKCVSAFFIRFLRLRWMRARWEPDTGYKRQRFSNEFEIYKTQKQIWLQYTTWPFIRLEITLQKSFWPDFRVEWMLGYHRLTLRSGLVLQEFFNFL